MVERRGKQGSSCVCPDVIMVIEAQVTRKLRDGHDQTSRREGTPETVSVS